MLYISALLYILLFLTIDIISNLPQPLCFTLPQYYMLCYLTLEVRSHASALMLSFTAMQYIMLFYSEGNLHKEEPQEIPRK